MNDPAAFAGLAWDLDQAVDPTFGAQFAQAASADGFEGLSELLAPEGTWHISGTGPFAGEHHGVEAVLGLLGRLREAGIKFSFFDTLVSDAHCGLLLTLDKQGETGKLSVYVMWLMHVDDDRVSECFWYFEDPAGLDAIQT